LSGGNQSADSFATSRRIFKPSATLCFFARILQVIRGPIPRRGVDSTHIDPDPDYSQRQWILPDSVSETCLCFRWMDVVVGDLEMCHRRLEDEARHSHNILTPGARASVRTQRGVGSTRPIYYNESHGYPLTVGSEPNVHPQVRVLGNLCHEKTWSPAPFGLWEYPLTIPNLIDFEGSTSEVGHLSPRVLPLKMRLDSSLPSGDRTNPGCAGPCSDTIDSLDGRGNPTIQTDTVEQVFSRLPPLNLII